MERLKKISKLHYVVALAAIFIWAITFYTDTKIFTSEPLNMNCLPIDLAMVPFMHITSKVLLLLFIFGLLEFFVHAYNKPKLIGPFLFFLLIYGIGLLLSYPGYFMSDDPIIFAYATRYYPVYWHSYLTSLFYMTAMSAIPASCGPVLVSDILYALVYAYIFYEGSKLFRGKKVYLLLVSGVLPFTLLGALMCFRPAIYAPFFVFYFAFLFFEWKNKRQIAIWKVGMLSFLTALLSLWRSEGLVLVLFGIILFLLVYRQKTALYLFCLAVFFIILKIPQSIGEKKYYGSDYLIISTTRPLSVIVHREQTYEGAEKDLANVSAITEYGYLHNDSLSCSAYNRYNSDHNEGKYTQTSAAKEAQSAYLKSAFRLIWHNLDLYIGERTQLFLVTNGIFHYNKDMVLNLKPVVTTDFPLYEHDREYGFEMLDAYKRISVNRKEGYAGLLFRFGGEAYIPCLLLAFVLLIGTLLKKKWFYFTIFLSLFAREAVIFLSAPASFIQYSYPMMYVTVLIAMLILLSWMEERKR